MESIPQGAFHFYLCINADLPRFCGSLQDKIIGSMIVFRTSKLSFAVCEHNVRE